MTVLGKINKDFLLYNGIYQVTKRFGLVFSRIKTLKVFTNYDTILL
jgi:hypothetical protein